MCIVLDELRLGVVASPLWLKYGTFTAIELNGLDDDTAHGEDELTMKMFIASCPVGTFQWRRRCSIQRCGREKTRRMFLNTSPLFSARFRLAQKS